MLDKPAIPEHSDNATAQKSAQPRLGRLRGGWYAVWNEGNKRRRWRLNATTPYEAKLALAKFEKPAAELLEKPQEGFVYFFQCQEGCRPIKIGHSVDVWRRFKDIETTCPFPLEILGTVPGLPTDEAALHGKFAEHRINGEWFQPHESLLEFIAQEASEFERPDRRPKIEIDWVGEIQAHIRKMAQEIREREGTA